LASSSIFAGIITESCHVYLSFFNKFSFGFINDFNQCLGFSGY